MVPTTACAFHSSVRLPPAVETVLVGQHAHEDPVPQVGVDDVGLDRDLHGLACLMVGWEGDFSDALSGLWTKADGRAHALARDEDAEAAEVRPAMSVGRLVRRVEE